MGWIQLLICTAALYLPYQSDDQIVFLIAAVNAGANYWSFGVLFASRDNTDSENKNWAKVGIVTTFIGASIIIYSLLIKPV